MPRQSLQSKRKGSIVVLALLLIVVLLAVVALAVDVGFLCVTRQQLQRSADSAALAACWELIDRGAPTRQSNPTLMQHNVQSTASEFAGLNEVLQKSPDLGTGRYRVRLPE